MSEVANTPLSETCIWCDTPVPSPLPSDWYTIIDLETGDEHVCPACAEATDHLIEIEYGE